MNNFPNIEIQTSFKLNLVDSERDTAIAHEKIVLAYEDDDGTFGELRVFHSKWDSVEYGYVYGMACSDCWLRELRDALLTIGFGDEVAIIDFSEGGMQGRRFISLDINSGRGKEAGMGKAFIEKFKQIAAS